MVVFMTVVIILDQLGDNTTVGSSLGALLDLIDRRCDCKKSVGLRVPTYGVKG